MHYPRGFWHQGRFYRPIAGGSGDGAPDEAPAPTVAAPPAPADPAAALRRELEQYQRLAEERAAALARRDAELEQLRQTAVAHEQATQQAQAALLEAHRARLLAEHRGAVVPELIQGATLDELSASVERAQAAYTSVAEAVRQQAAASVPPGNAARGGPDLTTLSPQEKIAYGLRNGR